jgi:hypothetical protein
MWPRLILSSGILIVGLVLVAWWLLSGFGCEMNTSGCSVVRLDLGQDALRIFLPPIGLGLVLGAIGYWKMRYPSRSL